MVIEARESVTLTGITDIDRVFIYIVSGSLQICLVFHETFILTMRGPRVSAG